jgi:hypothetical protein
MKKLGRPAGKTDPDTRYKMWLCYLLASECPEGDELPLQHDGAFEVVGKPLGLGAKSVGRYSLKARKLLVTAEGDEEFYEWRNKREVCWWLYHVLRVEKREKVLLEYVGERDGNRLILTRGHVRITPKDAEAFISEAKERLKHPWCRHDYEVVWLAEYERRPEEARHGPMLWGPTPPAEAKAVTEKTWDEMTAAR